MTAPRNRERIAQIFMRLASIYGPAWSSHYAGETGMLAMAEWGEELSSLGDNQIQRGITRCRRRTGYPPSLPEFRELCLSPWEENEIDTAVSRALSVSHMPADEIPDLLVRELVRSVPQYERRHLTAKELTRRFKESLPAVLSKGMGGEGMALLEGAS